MGSWRRSLSEILVVSRCLNATLVEPCIKNGRLVSCGDNEAGSLVKLGDVFSLTRMKEFHPAISSFEDYKKYVVNDTPRFTICMHHGNPTDACGDSKSLSRKKNSTQVDQSVETSLQRQSILEVTHFRRQAFSNMIHNGAPLVQKDQLSLVNSQYLTFRNEHYVHAKKLLREMGVNGTFAVIHWRAELENIDYMGCAQAILKAKEAMNMTNTSFVLMSSLNKDENLQWGGVHRMSKNTTSQEALSFLSDAGIYKLDRVVDEVQDLIYLAVWDLILAGTAEAFATCTGGCRSFCSKCNYQGAFAKLAAQLRENNGKESVLCWPS